MTKHFDIKPQPVFELDSWQEWQNRMYAQLIIHMGRSIEIIYE